MMLFQRSKTSSVMRDTLSVRAGTGEEAGGIKQECRGRCLEQKHWPGRDFSGTDVILLRELKEPLAVEALATRHGARQLHSLTLDLSSNQVGVAGAQAPAQGSACGGGGRGAEGEFQERLRGRLRAVVRAVAVGVPAVAKRLEGNGRRTEGGGTDSHPGKVGAGLY